MPYNKIRELQAEAKEQAERIRLLENTIREIKTTWEILKGEPYENHN